ncbi:LLM class flavin-dependent oxidoreductase [Streptomyces chilikensis]|uniref:LLM class flavin-dependent oxidoreductase n=1 Tax=Streptomyces chilikensis TaxID=1194079 RepID=A0ABV3EVJ9_9ACTN
MSYLWYIPNQIEPGHRGDDAGGDEGWGTLEHSTDLARTAEDHGWEGALLGTGWGRPDTFTLAAALTARTTTFKPLIAVRPGYWQPAHFASSAATLDHLSGGRVLVNIVSGLDSPAAYGDRTTDPAHRYERTREFVQLVRRLWTEENVTHRGEHFAVENSSVLPHPGGYPDRHPTLYFGGASEAAERVAAAEADVQLFWGEPLEGLAERIERLKKLEAGVEREHQPLEFGLRITTLVRDTTEEAWRDAEAKVAAMAEKGSDGPDRAAVGHRRTAVGQRRLLELAARGEVLDTCLYTTPGTVGGGGAATTWLVGSADDVAQALQRYRELGISHFVLSDTPYKQETVRVGDELLPRLRALESAR